MAIKLVQTCDGCGAERELKVGYHGQARDIRMAAERDGWRMLRDNVHACNNCIKDLLSRKLHTS